MNGGRRFSIVSKSFHRILRVIFQIGSRLKFVKQAEPKAGSRKNAYWQKRLRQQYHSVIAAKPELRQLKDFVPVWLLEEVRSFGRVHWLKIHAAKGGEKYLWKDRNSCSTKARHAPHRLSAPEARYQKLRADILSVETWRRKPRKIKGKAERLDVRGQCLRCRRSRKPIYYIKSDVGKTFVCSPCRDRLLPKKDALDHAVSGGAFGMNRRRH